MTRALVLSAPQTGSGKTLLTLGLARALRGRGIDVAVAKAGPDYIDPAFHAAATGRPCPNLDSWAMRPATLAATLAGIGAERLLIEGVMGLFDGAPAPGAAGDGSTADLVRRWALPVLLIVDGRGLAASAAALLHGFRSFDPAVAVAGVLFNRVRSDRHAAILKVAAARAGLPVLGCVPEAGTLTVPSRHLGLVQASEHADLDGLIARAADHVAAHVDLTALLDLMRVPDGVNAAAAAVPAPPGMRIALARDDAFRFAYPHILDGWRRGGATILPFAPLDGGAVPADADAVILPGGYPELHAGVLAGSDGFLRSLRAAAARGLPVLGECGGYMVLGRAIIDAEGHSHEMAGLLPVVTSFAVRRRTLGYRRAVRHDGRAVRGHEYHHATVAAGAAEGAPLLVEMTDAAGTALGPAGHRQGRIEGSFLHVIDAAD